MDAANLLRSYARTLDDAREMTALVEAHKAFLRAKPRDLSSAEFDAMMPIWTAHKKRVRGDGSPALCDEALQTAIKDIGNA
jgi:hypothetical protein